MQGTTGTPFEFGPKPVKKIHIFLNFIQDKALDGINPPDNAGGFGHSEVICHFVTTADFRCARGPKLLLAGIINFYLRQLTLQKAQ